MLPARFGATASLSFSKTGIWYPAVNTGMMVKKGDTIGVVKDLQGRELETLLAPEEGLILYMTAAPPVSQGESAITIARPQRAQ
jgi:predicted deacylase